MEVKGIPNMILYCRKCGHIWRYGGDAKRETSCPACQAYVNLQQQVDKPLPAAGDYSDARYLGVTRENAVLYYDDFHEVVVWFIGDPDPFLRSEEDPVPREDIEEWLRELHWDIGLKYKAEEAEPKKADTPLSAR